MQINSSNERIKKQYLEYLKEAKEYSILTIDNIRKSILRWEEYTNHKDFSITKELAIGFKKSLTGTKAKRSGKPLSLSTMNSTINELKDFFKWLSYQNGYKRKINILHVAYLSLSANEIRAAKSSGFKPYPTLEQIRKVIFSMPNNTDIEKRNQSLLAFTLLTAMRDGAIASLKLKHIDLEHNLVKQDPREVKTKNRKNIDTFFFPVGDDIKQIFINWVLYLKQEKLYGNDDPVFPRTMLSLDENNSFSNGGLEPINWTNASPIMKIFKEAFTGAGLDYYSPHTFRKTIVNLGEKLCKNPEEFKAWSQNIGHESPLTTFISYGYVDVHRQGDIIKNIATCEKQDPLKAIMARLDKMENPATI